MNSFMSIAIKGVILLGAMGIAGGVILICVMHDTLAGAACLGIGSSVVSGIFGVMIAPIINPQQTAPAPGAATLSPEVAAFAAAMGGAVDRIKSL